MHLLKIYKTGYFSSKFIPTTKFKNFTRAVLRTVVLPRVVHNLLEVAYKLLVVVVHVVLDLVLHVLQAHRLLHVPVVVVHLVRVHQLQEDVSELLEARSVNEVVIFSV